MADITMCKGQDCPLKLSCYRYNATKAMRQAYFISPPFKDGGCNHYLEDKEKAERYYNETFNAKDCQFYPKIDTTSATICANCGREKFEHNF